MFVNFNLEDINNNKVHLEGDNQRLDLEKIIKCFKIEGFELTNWNLIEIAKSNGKRIYGFEDVNKNLVYMKINTDKKVTPHYFKNHSAGEYSEFQAESIIDAIKRYERFYIG